MPHRPIRELRDGDALQDTYLLIEKELRQAAQGPYLHLVLGDTTGRIPARVWEGSRHLFESLPAEGLVQVSGQVRSYKSRLQAHLTRVAPAPEGENLADFLPRSPHDPDALWERLSGVLRSIRHPDLRRLVESILGDDAIAARLRTVPAATTHHHACVGGLLEHLVALCRLADAVAPLYPDLDRDLLLAGILLHDIGKTEELAVGAGFRYTDAGKLVGHVGLGLALLERKARALDRFPDEALDALRHLIASHHGRREWGALCEPATREAIALHYLDNLDAKLNAAGTALSEASELPGNWTDYLKTFERSLYKGRPPAGKQG